MPYHVSFSVNNNTVTIEVLTGSNFKNWREDIMFGMEMADVHTALIGDKPANLTAESTEDQKMEHVVWSKSNRICLLSMKRTIPDHLKSGLPADCTAKEFMEAVSQRYRVSSNAKIGTLMQGLFNLKYEGNVGVRDYIIRIVHFQTKLKALNVSIPDSCIVHLALNTLPAEFGIIKTNYNSQDEAWSINDLITRVVAKEEKLKKEKPNSALFIANPTGSGDLFAEG